MIRIAIDAAERPVEELGGRGAGAAAGPAELDEPLLVDGETCKRLAARCATDDGATVAAVHRVALRELGIVHRPPDETLDLFPIGGTLRGRQRCRRRTGGRGADEAGKLECAGLAGKERPDPCEVLRPGRLPADDGATNPVNDAVILGREPSQRDQGGRELICRAAEGPG